MRVPPALIPLLVVMSLAAWLYPVGHWQVELEPDFLVRQLPFARGCLLGPEAAPDLSLPSRLMGWLGGTASLFKATTGLAQAATFLVLFLGLTRRHGWLAGWLGASLGFCWGQAAWLLTADLNLAIGHLLFTLALLSWLEEWTWAVPGLAALLLFVSPPLGWALVLALVLYGRWERPAAAAVGVALLAAALGRWPAPEFRLGPVLVMLLLSRLHPQGRLWLCLELGGQLAGLPGFGAAVGLGVCGGEWVSRRWQAAPPVRPALAWSERGLELGLPHRAMLTVLVVALGALGLSPAESVFNRSLLVAAQKKKIPIGSLFVPISLEEWVQGRGQLAGLGPDDLGLAQQLASHQGEVVVLSPGEADEPLVAAAVLACLAGRPLDGWWADPASPELLPGPALVRRLGAPELIDATVFFRGPVQVVEPVTGAPAPGQLVDLGQSGYQVERNGQPWGQPVKSRYLVVPTTPGRYTAAGQTFDSNLPAVLAGLRAYWSLTEKLPSRSLVKVPIELENSSGLPFSLDWVREVRLMAEPATGPTPIQSLAGGLLEGRRTVELWLATPDAGGDHELRLELTGPYQQKVEVPFDPPAVMRSWQRLPPVGTWEDPPISERP